MENNNEIIRMKKEITDLRNALMCVIILCSTEHFSGVKKAEKRKQFLKDINNNLEELGIKQLDFEDILDLEKFCNK